MSIHSEELEGLRPGNLLKNTKLKGVTVREIYGLLVDEYKNRSIDYDNFNVEVERDNTDPNKINIVMTCDLIGQYIVK